MFDVFGVIKICMAHKKAGGSTSLGRDSAGRRLGLKLTDGQWAKIGSIIVRQRGTKYYPGLNVKKGRDDTLFSLINGFVKFSTKKLKKFNSSLKTTKVVSVFPPTKTNPAPDEKTLRRKTPPKKGGTIKSSAYHTTAKKNLIRQQKIANRQQRLLNKKTKKTADKSTTESKS